MRFMHCQQQKLKCKVNKKLEKKQKYTWNMKLTVVPLIWGENLQKK